MKTILTSLLFAVSLFAGAATQTDVTYPAPAQFELQSGGVKLSTHASLAEAIAAATAKGAGTYSVVQPTATIVVTVTADPTPPAAADPRRRTAAECGPNSASSPSPA